MIYGCPSLLLPWVSIAYICHVVYLFSYQKQARYIPFTRLNKHGISAKKTCMLLRAKTLSIYNPAGCFFNNTSVIAFLKASFGKAPCAI